MKPWHSLDPRRHLGAAIGWAVLLVVILFAVAAGAVAAAQAEREVRRDSEYMLDQFATGIDHALDAELEIHRQILQAAAARIAASGDLGGPALRGRLDALQHQFPEFGWLGVADAQGRIVAATQDLRLGQDVSESGWFRQALPAAATATATAAHASANAPPPAHAIEFAAPLRTAENHGAGVLAGTLRWTWIDRRATELLSALDPQHRLGLDVVLAAGDRTVSSGPGHWRGRTLTAATDLSEQGAFVVGRAAAGPQAPDQGRPVRVLVVRQQAETAVARAQAVGHTVFLSVLGAGLLAAVIAVLSVRVLVRRLARLAGQAQAVGRGEPAGLSVPAGDDEVSRIGAVLVRVVEQLRHEKRMLERLNAELDQRVAERTERLERLADDARHAAVTRERLRLARDLHDTLAHSMMALLTQIRLVRKLRARWDERQLEQELERAESVAASGLAEARAAIHQMRHSGVRESGLGPALRELSRRFIERTGLGAVLQIEAQAGGLAGERAETVFRIVEEALHNIERHARAGELRLSLGLVRAAPGDDGPDAATIAIEARRPLRLRLEVGDDGVGFEPGRPQPMGHFGLSGMREQAALIGARLELISRPGHGTRVLLEFDA